MFSPDDAARLATWMADEVDPSGTAVEVRRLGGGHSSGAWRLDVSRGGAVVPLVLKAPDVPSVVHRRDAVREARILDALGRMGAPVPAIVAVDDGTRAIGRPCFVMEHVDGRSLSDPSPASYHDAPWLRDPVSTAQPAVW